MLTNKQIKEIKEEYNIADLIKDAKECKELMTGVKTVDDLLNLVERNFLENELDSQPIKLCNGDVYYGFGELLDEDVDINERVHSFTLEAFGDIEFPSVRGLNDKPEFTFDIYPKEYDPYNEIAKDVSIEDLEAILDEKKMETLKRTGKEQDKGKEDR